MAATVMGHPGRWTIYSAAVNCAAGDTTALVAAVSGKRISLLGLVGTANVAGTITLKSGSTAISGVMPVGAVSGFVLPICPETDPQTMGWCRTVAGAALNLTTVTCEFDGVLRYAVED